MAPQLGRVFLDQVGAQQISTLARADLPQFVAIEAIAEGGGVCGDLDYRQAPGNAGLIARGAESHQQLLARQLSPCAIGTEGWNPASSSGESGANLRQRRATFSRWRSKRRGTRAGR